jgi:endonuclease/exonuclease/phosphatase family metal-dependent hydrolase
MEPPDRKTQDFASSLELQLSLKFLTWNLENFFLAPSSISLHNSAKDPAKITIIAEIMKEARPDVMFLTEVGGEESLVLLNKKYLDDRYQVSFLPTNSNRGIDLGYLVSKDFLEKQNLEIKQFSHIKEPLDFIYPHDVAKNKAMVLAGRKPTKKSERISRDLAELYLINRETRSPLFIILGVHLKSKLDKEGIDWHGSRRRKAECLYTINHYRELTERYGGEIPIFITGDFNGEAHLRNCEPELADIYRDTQLMDFTDALSLDREDCYSFSGFDRSKKSFGVQLDYFFVSKKWHHYLEKAGSGVLRYKNPEGGVFPLPQTPGARHALPSDHYPLIIEFSPWY